MINKEIINKKLLNEYDLYYFDEVDSTNNKIKEIVDKKNQGNIIVIANGQYEGRGRYGKKFLSPKGCGIYMSILLKAKPDIEENLYITPMIAVAIKEAIDKILKIKVEIKWLNDIYIDDSKVGGILCEMIDNKWIIIGIGINTSDSTAIKSITDRKVLSLFIREPLLLKEELISEIVNNIDNLNMSNKNLYIHNKYNDALYKKNNKVKIITKNEVFNSVTIMGVDSKYNLLALVDEEIKIFNSGYVEIIY